MSNLFRNLAVAIGIAFGYGVFWHVIVHGRFPAVLRDLVPHGDAALWLSIIAGCFLVILMMRTRRRKRDA